MNIADLRRAPDLEFEYEVLDLLEAHRAQEASLLESHRQIAEESSSGDDVRYVVAQIGTFGPLAMPRDLPTMSSAHDLVTRSSRRL
jgi:hypothetical protein